MSNRRINIGYAQSSKRTAINTTRDNYTNPVDNRKARHAISPRNQHGPQDPKQMLILIDSNRRNIDFDQLFPDVQKTVQPCGSVDWALSFLEKSKEDRYDTVLIHLGTNDLKQMTPEDFLSDLRGPGRGGRVTSDLAKNILTSPKSSTIFLTSPKILQNILTSPIILDYIFLQNFH